ncbi:hypothetical protein [Acetobacter malorum]|uniref:Uncharacterized protein n=2 Tax=Acetobacter malorum TaxID=178901 RepID=A0A149UKH6_9PROT|nr:hypothetical protein [Acetobacter malorum]KXV05865.1 hypothetical protein AD930_09890 [Acetobacter malorum]KXV15891.1 hypothetical protein AD933_08170 [Acetobacter malorum]KXV68490.1 hypothetical protein AD951_10885 [Acetobacter malorum]GBQ78691.1 hypothetical protein AA14337_1226 [Acetobacter malorum DSM 14337]
MFKAAPKLLLGALLLLTGCYNIGSRRLDQDQSDYSFALITAGKRQTLLNIVRLRYADTPGFLDTTQLISGYQLQRSFAVGVGTASPVRPSGNAGIQFQESPTFTFQPVTGDAYAQSFLRPMPIGSLLPLAMGGLPIDVLFRLAVQSVNLISNAGSIGGDVGRGSPEFFELIHDLRVLQVAGLLGIQLEHSAEIPGKTPSFDRVFLNVSSTDNPILAETVYETRRFFQMKPKDERVEVVYGAGQPRPGQIRILTRTMLGALGQIAYQIDVPQDDITSGRTQPRIQLIGRETKPIVVVHVGKTVPDNTFTSVQYDKKYYYIYENDFDSKLAFTMLQILLELSKTTKSPGTIVTIPVNG